MWSELIPQVKDRLFKIIIDATYLTVLVDFSVAFKLSEWVTNQHRDTYASHVAHYDQLSYYAVAQNQSIGRARLEFLQKMIQPCGP
jgi:Splicing factor 3B subunit 10 (SF3b10)